MKLIRNMEGSLCRIKEQKCIHIVKHKQSGRFFQIFPLKNCENPGELSPFLA